MRELDLSKTLVYPLDRNSLEISEGSDGLVHVTNRLAPECGLDLPSSDSPRRFHLRMYLPTRPLVEKDGGGIERVFILINGLNEVDYLSPHDQIAKFLARQGIAAVLVPTPNHLFRHPKFRKSSLTERARADHPESMPISELRKDPTLMYQLFRQYLTECSAVVQHITGKCPVGHPDCKFYRRIFANNVRVSVLGYSLGGLAALCLKLSHKVSSCILLNSGASLGDIHLPDSVIGRKDWLELVKRITAAGTGDDVSTDARHFRQVFLGKDTEELQNELKKLSRQIMLIVGGADAVVQQDHISRLEPQRHGLHTLKVPGLSHFLGGNPRWHQWLDICLDHVIRFDAEAGSVLRTADEVTAELAELNIEHNIVEEVQDPNEIGRTFRRLVVSHLCGAARDSVEAVLHVARCLYWTEHALATKIAESTERIKRKRGSDSKSPGKPPRKPRPPASPLN